MTEYQEALTLANKILDRPGGDPDDDLAVLARQFLRAVERATKLRNVVKEVHGWIGGMTFPTGREEAERLIARMEDVLTWRGYEE